MKTSRINSLFSLCFIAMLSCPLTMPSMVICFADCGHVAIEAPQHGQCHNHDHGDDQPKPHQHNSNDCEDIALVMVTMTRPDVQMPITLTGEITWTAVVTEVPTLTSTISPQIQKPPPQSDCIRSVVLIV